MLNGHRSLTRRKQKRTEAVRLRSDRQTSKTANAPRRRFSPKVSGPTAAEHRTARRIRVRHDDVAIAAAIAAAIAVIVTAGAVRPVIVSPAIIRARIAPVPTIVATIIVAAIAPEA